MPNRPKVSLADTLAILERAAAAGERCPVSSGPDASANVPSAHVSALAKAGRISVEISSRNWRQITILTGPNANKATAPNPDKHARVYQTIDAGGTRVNGKLTDHGAARRSQPSAPRFLTRDELA